MGMERIRVAAIGTGGIFVGAHLTAYPEIPEAKLVALCDVDKRSLQNALSAFQKAYRRRMEKAEEEKDKETYERLKEDIDGIRTYSSYEEMLGEEDLDLVDICTPPKYHAPAAIAALEAGVHVMCEKPMARTWLECLDVVEAVEKSGRFYQHNENWIYDPLWYTAKKAIDSGAIGDPIAMFLATAHGGPENKIGFWIPEVSGGGSLLDNGIHAITTSWFLAGFDKKPFMVRAARPYGISVRMGERILDGAYTKVVVEDDAHILILFKGDEDGSWVTAHVEGSWSHRDSMDTMIIGTSGTISFVHEEGRSFLEISDPFGSRRRMQVSGPTWTFYPSSFYGEIRSMCKSVISGTKPVCDERIGAESTAIVGAAYLSQIRGKGITVDEFKDYALELKRSEGDRASDLLIERMLEGISGRGGGRG
jgi:predicted dehydrogenase